MGRYQVRTEPLKITVNPATPFTVVPEAVFIQAVSQILRNVGTNDFECFDTYCKVKKPCARIQGPGLTLQLNNEKFFEVPRQSLLIDATALGIDEPSCVLGLTTSAEESTQD